MNKKITATLCTLMAAATAFACFALGACAEDPYKGIVGLDLENSSDFIFEAEEAKLVGKAMRPSSKSVKEDFDLYRGNGHVVEHESAHGGKYVGYMGANKGDYIEYEIESAVPCYATLSISAASNLRLYYFICWRDVDTGVFVNGEQVFAKENHEETIDIVALSFNENIVYENVKLKKGVNTIRIQALAEEELQYWHVDRRPKAFDIFGKKYSKIPNIDYIKITASVGEDNFTFKNRKTDNEINTNGKNTLNSAPWFNGYTYTDEDYASYDTWVDNL